MEQSHSRNTERLLVIIYPISGRKSKHKVVSAIASCLDVQKYVGGDGTINEVARSLVRTNRRWV